MGNSPRANSGFSEQGSLQFAEHLISTDYTYGYGIAAADLNGDGHIDLTSSDCTTRGSRIHNDIYWFENDGKGNFTRHSLWSEDRIGRFERHRIADINRDGHPDLVIVDNFHGDVLWFENSGHPQDGKPWRRHAITEGACWALMTWTLPTWTAMAGLTWLLPVGGLGTNSCGSEIPAIARTAFGKLT